MGASPETCIKVEGGHLEIRPIAGTAPRGFRADGTLDQDLDGRLSIGLLLDDKEIVPKKFRLLGAKEIVLLRSDSLISV